jgi:type I restriction enzyme S subunit
VSERNENRPGYKKTKVGWIPEEWDTQPLEWITHPGRRIVYGIVQAGPYIENGVPYIRSTDVGGGIDPEDLPKTSEEIAERYSRSEVKPGDLIFSLRGNIGETSIVPSYLPRANLTQGTARISVGTSHNNKFIQYCLKKSRVHKRILAVSKGSTFKEISLRDLRRINVPLPSLPEQKKIAEILSTWDKAIDQTRRLIDAKKRRKKALMQQLLTGEKRLPEFNRTWAECSLGDVFNERREVNGHNLQLLAITGSRGVIPASEIERKDSSNPDKSKYKIIRKGDIGYNTMRMWQGVSAVSDLDGIVSPAYTICIAKEDVNVRFMGYFFKFPPIVYLFWRYSQGLVSDTLNLKFNNFAQIKVTIPGLKEQQAITKVLSSADNEIVTLEKKLTALEKQKRGLMQKLLTGEVRVKT